MRKEWVVILTTTVEAVNSSKRKKILNIYSVTVQHIIERLIDLLGNYIHSNVSDIVATDIRAILKFVLRLVLPRRNVGLI